MRQLGADIQTPLQPAPASERPTPAARRSKSSAKRNYARRSTPAADQQSRPGLSEFVSGWRQFDERAYRADPCPAPSLSSHIAILAIEKSLHHAWRAHPKSPLFEHSTASAAADRGSAAHALLFGEDRICVVDAEDYRTGAARTARDEARVQGRIPVLAKEFASIQAMIETAAIRFRYLHGGTFTCEQSACWQADGGGWRRARLDTLSPDRTLIVDYKTTEGPVDALSCERRIADMGLQIQAAAYVDAVETLHPELRGRVRFIFQWQEQKPPYALSPPIEMSEAFLCLGRAQWNAAGALWDQALRHDAFPAYGSQPFLACPPPWELSRWEERERMAMEWAVNLDARRSR